MFWDEQNLCKFDVSIKNMSDGTWYKLQNNFLQWLKFHWHNYSQRNNDVMRKTFSVMKFIPLLFH